MYKYSNENGSEAPKEEAGGWVGMQDDGTQDLVQE